MGKQVFLIVASFPDSLVKFRGSLIDVLLDVGLEVHVAAPAILYRDDVLDVLAAKGVGVHDIPLQRTGTNPFGDVKLLFSLVLLMRRIAPDFFLGYTIKPVVYGTLSAWISGVSHRFALVTGLGYAFTGEVSGKRALLRSVIKYLYRFALKRTDLVFSRIRMMRLFSGT